MPPRAAPTPTFVSPYAADRNVPVIGRSTTDIAVLLALSAEELEDVLRAAFRPRGVYCEWKEIGASEKTGKAKAIQCGRLYATWDLLARHLKKSHCQAILSHPDLKHGTASRPAKIYQCRWGGCGNVKVATTEELYDHLVEEHIIRLLYVPCPYADCKKRPANLPKALEHVRKDHLAKGYSLPPPLAPIRVGFLDIDLQTLPDSAPAYELGVQAFACPTTGGPAPLLGTHETYLKEASPEARLKTRKGKAIATDKPDAVPSRPELVEVTTFVQRPKIDGHLDLQLPRAEDDDGVMTSEDDEDESDSGNESDHTIRAGPSSARPSPAATMTTSAPFGRRATTPAGSTFAAPRDILGAGFGASSAQPAWASTPLPPDYWLMPRTGWTAMQASIAEVQDEINQSATRMPSPKVVRAHNRTVVRNRRGSSVLSTHASRSPMALDGSLSPLTEPPESEPDSPVKKRARYAH
ncbi:hypothetical protein CALVIDRAFT_564610 [Calocera viscosa TUFC12733]|uniref:C2H2-type domain-containing protein n=1 Tax=Calocera viscosa (strain TUFC12733) TaxID=1330018 RepID=A0A167LCU2_CALVF|nr:hypothetical protein CALVIDRAFT_564610 [Calocera viscosa TUFC12733]